MARKVYFAFHYQNDIWRVNHVRQSDITKGDRDDAGYYDKSLWEESKRNGDEGIKRMILDGLYGSSVTVFLLGTETARRPWVIYELQESWKRGNGLLSVFIHNQKDQQGNTAQKGEDILAIHTIEIAGKKYPLSQMFKSYDWILNNGYMNIGTWIEEAYQLAELQQNMKVMPKRN